MNDDVAILYQHAKKPYVISLDDTVTAQRLAAALARLVAAGFSVDADGGRLKVSPVARLSATQRDWIKTHKAALVAAVSTPCWRWCIEYPRHAVMDDSGTRLVCDYGPAADWRQVSSEYLGATVWPAPDEIDVADWIDAGMPAVAPPEAV